MQTVPAQELECYRPAALARHPNIKPGQEFTGVLISSERKKEPISAAVTTPGLVAIICNPRKIIDWSRA
jgi:hypothetical protein